MVRLVGDHLLVTPRRLLLDRYLMNFSFRWVISIFVEEKARRQGIAKRLFAAMQADADKIGVQTVNLRVEVGESDHES